MSSTTTVLIAGGGTAGHTNPGIATAQALVSAGMDRELIHFVGGVRGNEAELVPAAGFTIDALPGRGIRRSLAPGAIVANVGAVVDLGRAVVAAFSIVRRRRPSVVLCLGGYAAFAPSVAAVVLRIPLVVSEQNARASLVNRIMARAATRSALPFPDTDLPKGELTGNPIRPAVVEAVQEADRAGARRTLGLPDDRVVVAAWAGSLGAASINRSVAELAERWRDRADLALYHVVGQREWETYAGLGQRFADAPLHYEIVAYTDRMPELLAAADLAVCRSGASTVSELAVAGLPAVLVPLPNAPRDHQRANGAELVTVGGARMIDDADVGPSTLDAALADLIAEPSARARMAAAARSVGRPGAADAVARLLLLATDTEPSGRS